MKYAGSDAFTRTFTGLQNTNSELTGSLLAGTLRNAGQKKAAEEMMRAQGGGGTANILNGIAGIAGAFGPSIMKGLGGAAGAASSGFGSLGDVSGGGSGFGDFMGLWS